MKKERKPKFPEKTPDDKSDILTKQCIGFDKLTT